MKRGTWIRRHGVAVGAVSAAVGFLLGCSSASEKARSAQEPSPPKSSQQAAGKESPSTEPIPYRPPDCDGRSFASAYWFPPKLAARQDGSTGWIVGTVNSTEGDPLAGVTAVATSPALSGTETALTDGGGRFRIGRLPPGTYVVTFYYSDITERIDGVQVKADEAATLEQSIDTAEAGREVIEIKDTAPMIDARPADPCRIGDFPPWPQGLSAP